MKNMKISKKILCTFGGVIVLFIIAVGSCVLALRSANQRIEEFYTKPHQAISLGGELMTSLETSAKEMGFAIVAKNEGTFARKPGNCLQRGCCYAAAPG